MYEVIDILQLHMDAFPYACGGGSLQFLIAIVSFCCLLDFLTLYLKHETV